MHKDAYKIGTELSNEGQLIGRDPRKMTVEELNQIGHIKKPLSKVIREKCLDCCAGQISEVKNCVCVTCPLWAFRMKKNPFSERKITDEQKQKAGERMKKARQAQ